MMARRKAETCRRECSITKVLHEVVLLGKYDKSRLKEHNRMTTFQFKHKLALSLRATEKRNDFNMKLGVQRN